jgi:intracellular sulfur oxidation DsrE/DsrF family protein
MKASEKSYRRGFLRRVVGTVAAASASIVAGSAVAAQESKLDDWVKDVKGNHRCFFDFPQHKNGLPLLHILNYLNTYSAYKVGPGQVGAVGTFYGIGSQSSIPFAFTDAIWARYQLGEYTGLKDAAGKAYTRNVFYRPTKDDLHVLMQAVQTPTIPAFAEAMPALGIESLQKMGTTFLICANALDGWCLELEARGKGKAADIETALRASLLPGVTIVPAMVIAIEQAQAAGIRYNRQ